MKKFFAIFLVSFFFCFTQTSYAATLCVNPTGTGGCYSSIQAAINAAVTNDTVKVMPGTYYECISINKKIWLMGSGHGVTKINCYEGAAVRFVAGSNGAYLIWFTIQSGTGNGIEVSIDLFPFIFNNVIQCCGASGIWVDRASPVIANNVIYKNTWTGIHFTDGVYSPFCYNNIISNNYSCGYGCNAGSGACPEEIRSENNCFYNNLAGNFCNGHIPGPGDIQLDPQFVNPTCESSADFHLKPGSPCIDKGREGFPDCDGTRGDMGVYGGPNAYCGPGPVVTDLQLVPSTAVKGETFNIQATGATR
jgi:hypothetical protein